MQQAALPLEDIILPPAISWWPLAWGWWALIVLSLIILAALVYGWLSWRKRRQQQAAALQALTTSTENLTGSALYSAINYWLKLQLKTQHPQTLHLHGQAWAEFLQQSTRTPIFNDELLQALSQGVYQTQPVDISREQCLAAAKQWLRTKKQIQHGGQHA